MIFSIKSNALLAFCEINFRPNSGLEMGYTEISSFLENGELVKNLLKEKSI